MIESSLSAPGWRRVFPLAVALGVLAPLSAQTGSQASGVAEPPTALQPFVTTATRTPADPQTVGSAVTAISADELAAAQLSSVADALALATGAPLFQSGAAGATTSLFLRGANSNQTLFLVDGIRLNDANTDYQAFLGGATVGAGDRLEVARGPQSTLYGAEAIGGVVSLTTARGQGMPRSQVGAEAGSYGTISGSAATQGAHGADAWNFSAQAGHTDNARPDNRFDSRNAALRLDHAVSPAVDVGGTVRWYNGVLGSPGDRFTNDPNDHESESNLLATAFVDAKPGTGWRVHAILGGQDRRYIADTPAPNPPYDSPSATNIVTNRRGVLDVQTTYTGFERNRITAGATGETDQTRSTGFGKIDQHEQTLAVFAQDEFSPADDVYLTAGLRNDHFDTFGNATTGRATAAWLLIPRTVKLRASYGTGFRAPSFLDLYGRDAYYIGNPRLTPEHERGVDAGIDYYLPGARGSLSATWFQSDFRNLIEYDFSAFPSTEVNVGRARTQGVELAARADLPGAVAATVSYTYLDAKSLDATGRQRLLRRPLNEVSADLHRAFGGGITAGVGVQYVGRRADVDAQTYATVTDGGYSILRLYAAWQVTARLTLKARVENALDRKYEPVNGYPALGAAAYGGVEWTF